jgi:SPRY domain
MNFLRFQKGKSRSGGGRDKADDATTNSFSPSNSLTLDDSIESILPASWDFGESFKETNLQLSHDGYDYTSVNIRNTSFTSRITIVANQPIPSSQLKKLAISRQQQQQAKHDGTSASQQQSTTTIISHPGMGDLSNLMPSTRSNSPHRAAGRTISSPGGLYPVVELSSRNANPRERQQEEAILSKMTRDSLYYFEVTVKTLPTGCDAAVGLVLDKVGASAGEFVPGETRDSIGLDTMGVLRVSGKIVGQDALAAGLMQNTAGKIVGFGEGDVIGCGLEVTGLRRVFFTKNGRTIVPPTRFADLDTRKLLFSPAVGMKLTRSKIAEAIGNFGVELNKPFVWAHTAYLAYKPAFDGQFASPSTASISSNHTRKTAASALTTTSTSQFEPPQSGSQLRPKKPPSRQKSDPVASSAPLSPRDYSSLAQPPYAGRNATSLSPSFGPDPRTRRARKNPPTMTTAEQGSDRQLMSNSQRGQNAIVRSNARRTFTDDAVSSDRDRSASMEAAFSDQMHASMSYLESEWKTTPNRRTEGSELMSGNSLGRTSMDFSAISEDDGEGIDPFLSGAPESNQALSPDCIEEEKTSMDESSRRDYNAPAGAGRLTPFEIEAMKENVRMLRSASRDDAEVDASVLESLLDCCRADEQTVKVALDKAMTDEDANVDLMELIGLNELVLEAVHSGEKALETARKRAAEAPAAKSSSNALDLDINGLIRKKDVFSLICILRAQSDQRLDTALALMEFARDGERPEDGGISLRDEIRSAGGMHSLLQVFRAKGTSYELRVVAGMAVAYVLPSFAETSPSVGLKIMECLRFLSTSRSVSPNGVKISHQMMFKASAMGVTAFWMNVLEPMLNPGVDDGGVNPDRPDLQLVSNSSTSLVVAGGIFDQRHQTLELQELLEMTVSLIVHIEKQSGSSVNGSDPQSSAAISMWRYTNIEQVCTVDVARPIAVREGLLPILVEWIKSKDKEKIRPAVSALRYLTSIKDKYMAGWIHSQMVNEGALSAVVKLADDYNAGHDVRLAVAQILATLCVAPHTRAAVVEANCMFYLIGFLYDHSDKASEEVALFAGRAITQLAAGAITRASVFGGGDPEILDFVSPDKRDSLVE